MRLALLGALAVLALPASARAECVLHGRAVVEGVRPDGTELSLTLDQDVDVTLDGSRSRVHGVAPVELDGRARSRDVHARLATDHELFGVLRVAAGTPARALSVEGDRVQVRMDLGATRVHATLRCADLALGPPPAETEPAGIDGQWIQARGAVLRLFRTASAGRPLVLRDRDPHDGRGLPLLRVVELRGRVHVQAELEAGVVLDGWMDRDDLVFGEVSAASGGGCGRAASIGYGCGWSYADEQYRGTSTVVAGTELSDGDGVVFGRVVADVEASIAISVRGRWARFGPSGEAVERGEDRVVYVERMTGFLPPTCAGLGFHVREADVRLPSPP